MNDSQIETIAEIAKKLSAEDDRRQRQSHTINELLNLREEVLVAMYGLAEYESKKANIAEVLDSLKSFSQSLVDYSALGHFEIYERIIDGKERRAGVSQVANQVYPHISETTEQFIEFNDKYDGADDPESLEGLYRDLSAVGEAMAARIDSEDSLLREMSAQVLNRKH